MISRGNWGYAVLAAVITVACAACSPAAEPARVAGPELVRYPAPSVLGTMPAPAFEMAEYRLDISCAAEDNTDDRALLSVNTGREYPSVQLEVLELDTGKRSLVVSAPATVMGDRYDILGCRLAGDWIAWEEVSVGETERAPEEVYWRLYLAPMPKPGSVVTSPTLVDGSRLADRSRPMFAFRGEELVWATNDREAVDGVSTGRKGIVRRLAPGGATAEVLRVPNGISAFNVSEDSLVFSHWLDPTGLKEGVRVVTPGQKTALIDLELPLVGILQHFPAYHAGDVSFRVAEESNPASAALLMRRGDGSMLNLGPEAMDLCFAGDYAFFDRDTCLSAVRVQGGSFEIVGMRLDDPATFVLASSKPQGEGVWQTSLAASGYRDTLVLYNDRSGWLGGKEQTLIRVYRGLEASSGTSAAAR